MPDIGKLTAIFDADTKGFDKGVAHVKRAVDDASKSFLGAGAGLKLLAGGSVLAAGALGGAAFGLFSAAKAAASYGAGLKDLSQRTGITVGTLSALKLAAEQSGSSIEGVNKSLAKYLGNISAANAGNTQVIEKFRAAGISLEELNSVYGKSDDAVSLLVTKVGKLSNEQDRLSALQLVGVRNGQELNGVITEMDGNLSKFRQEAERLGLVITPDQAKAADAFDDALNILEKQIKGMSYTIARTYMPAITGAITDISNSLANNQQAWGQWAGYIGSIVSNVIGGVAQVGHAIEGLGILIQNAFSSTGAAQLLGVAGTLASSVSGGGGAPLRDTGYNPLSPGASLTGLNGPRLQGGDIFSRIAPALSRVTTTTPKPTPRPRGIGGGSGGGGGRRGGGGGAPSISSGDFDEYYNLFDFYKKLNEEHHRILQDIIATPVSSVEALIRLYETIAGGFEAGHRALVGEGLSTATGQLRDLIESGAPSAAPLEAQVARRAEIRQQMQQLGNDLTNIFSNSIETGIQQGAAKGLVSLAQGLLNVVQNALLNRIAEGLGSILNNAGGGRGSWWKTLLNIGVSAITPSLGGLSSSFLKKGISSGPLTTTGTPLLTGLIHRASGGPVSAMSPYLVGERGPEMFIPGQSGQIVPNGGSNTYIINVPVRSAGSYSSPKSRREIARSIADAIQGAAT